jgi:hypothetical protein
MPTIQRSTTVAAGATDNNLISGSAFEYMRGPGIVSCAFVASAAGAFITINSGPDVILEESEAFVSALPVIPDHFYYNWGAAAGDRLVLRARNPTGGGILFRVVVNVQYTR